MSRGPYRDDRVHVLEAQCATCVFRPGNLMHLPPERMREITVGNVQADSALTCHSTLYRDDVEHAVCRGFFDRYGSATLPLRLAQLLDRVVFDAVPAAQP